MKNECHIHMFLKNPVEIVMTEENQVAFNMTTRCHICDKMLGNDEVRDCCHIYGKCKGAAHNELNFKLRINPHKIKPVVFNNLRGYDEHLIMSEIWRTKSDKRNRINFTPNNMEKYMTFNVGQH